MYTVATIWAIILLVIVVYSILNWKYFEFDTFVGVTMVGGFLGFLFGIFICWIINMAYDGADKVQMKTTYYIEAIQDNSVMGGSFFLGSGTIDSKPVYTMYVNYGSYFKIKTLDARGVKIIYSTSRPKLIKYFEKNADTAYNRWFNDVASESPGEYVIEIPRGSILNNYTLDAR